MSGALTWGPWSALDAQTDPYIHWWQSADGSSDYIETQFPVTSVDALQFARARTPQGRRKKFPSETEEVYPDGREIPVPLGSRNPSWDQVGNWAPKAFVDALAADGALDDITEATVLVGIIDTGIPLSHRRTRLASGRTRFLAAWQQSAQWDRASQRYLPFGRELYRSEIEDLLRATSRDGDLLEGVDETEFNRVAGLTEPMRLPGQGNRDLDHRSAHGAHVLDLAAGLDPKEQSEMADKSRLIAVNLPPPLSHGPHGNFLQFFALMAVERIVTIAEAIWVRKFGRKEGRFPLVVNFSYGMHAGPKDGSLPFEAAVEDLIQDYADRGGALRICMPSGNKNLERSSARLVPPQDDWVELDWRIVPDDHTSNLVELWTRPDQDLPLTTDYALALSPPQANGLVLADMLGDAQGHVTASYCDLTTASGGLVARVYLRPWSSGSAEKRLQILLCVAPTAEVEPLKGVALASAGAWTISLRRRFSEAKWVDAHVQVDQSAVLDSAKGRRSYFEDPRYLSRNDMGQTLDSLPYPFEEVVGDGSPIRRIGTHNPLATSPDITMVAGYNETSGAPAKYSGAAWDDRMVAGQARDVTVAMPSENSSVVFGLLAAGSRDGAMSAYRGTSMATGLATREIMQAMMTAGNSVGDPIWLGGQARRFETSGRPGIYGDAAAVKVGQGRLPMPESFYPKAVARVPKWLPAGSGGDQS